MSPAPRIRSGSTAELYSLQAPSRAPLSGGGDGGTFDDMEAVWKKIEDHEARFDKIDAKLDRILDTVNSMRIEMAEMKGKVAALPTTWQMITLVFGILGGAFLILKYGLPHIAA